MTEIKMERVTKRMNIDSLLKREDLTENERVYLLHELELLDKKNAYKDSKKATENETVRNNVLAVLTSEPLACSKIALKVNNYFGTSYSPQKIQPQLKILIDDGLVEKVKEKGVSLYKLAE